MYINIVDFSSAYCGTNHNLYAKSCDRCQRTRNIRKINEMPLTTILEVELFDVWGIDFIGPFPSFCGYKYIFFAIDYVSK